jgi:hypothetical protein
MKKMWVGEIMIIVMSIIAVNSISLRAKRRNKCSGLDIAEGISFFLYFDFDFEIYCSCGTSCLCFEIVSESPRYI